MLREAAHLQSAAELIQLRCRCKGNCTTVLCEGFKAKAECTLHCHGRDDGAQCINAGSSTAPSGTFNFEQNTKSAPLEPCDNLRRANIQGDACVHTDPTSAEDTANESSDLSDLDTEDEEVPEEEGVTGEEEEE